MIWKLIAIVVVSYLLGNLNGAILISKLVMHDDVRSHGSGNAGLTNFSRNYGGLFSIVVILIDIAKTVAACYLGRFLLTPEGLGLEGAALGAATVALGHDFPAFLGFKGGKGIMCGIASAFSLDWRVAALTLGIFLIAYLMTKYVSLGSVLGAVTLSSSFVLWHYDRPWACAGTLFFCILAIYMHRENINRLLHGTERKTILFKKEKKA